MSEKKIFTFPKKKRPSPGDTIDINNPVFHVYGVQQWEVKEVEGESRAIIEMEMLIGTSLYESAAKQKYVLDSIKESEEKREENYWKLMKLSEEKGAPVPPKLQKFKYRAINYPVY